jgi:hypothetical protein
VEQGSQGLENHRCGSWNVSHPSSLVEFLNEDIECSSKIEGGKFHFSQKGQLNFTRVVARGLRKFNSVVDKRLSQSVVGSGSWKKFWTQSQRITTTFS